MRGSSPRMTRREKSSTLRSFPLRHGRSPDQVRGFPAIHPRNKPEERLVHHHRVVSYPFALNPVEGLRESFHTVWRNRLSLSPFGVDYHLPIVFGKNLMRRLRGAQGDAGRDGYLERIRGAAGPQFELVFARHC